MRPLLLFVILLGMWLLMSGHYTPLITSLGIVSCGLAAALARTPSGRAALGESGAAARVAATLVELASAARAAAERRRRMGLSLIHI